MAIVLVDLLVSHRVRHYCQLAVYNEKLEEEVQCHVLISGKDGHKSRLCIKGLVRDRRIIDH